MTTHNKIHLREFIPKEEFDRVKALGEGFTYIRCPASEMENEELLFILGTLTEQIEADQASRKRSSQFLLEIIRSR